mgnify:CR=1 FL=1
MNDNVQLLDAADVSRTVARIAHQIIEKTALDESSSKRVILLGIPTRGSHLAHQKSDLSISLSTVMIYVNAPLVLWGKLKSHALVLMAR